MATRKPGDEPGPVAQAFMSARGTVQAINGPVGSGKTTALFKKASLIAPQLQRPSPVDGVRRRVVTVVHRDYRKLWAGPVQTWLKLWAQDWPYGEWQGARDEPAEHRLRYSHVADAGPVHVTVRFMAFGGEPPGDAMRGYETTDWLLMEADLLDEEVFAHAVTRLARAPGREHGDAVDPFIGLDFNAPKSDSWLFGKMDEWEESGWLFRQPPAAFEPSRGEFVPNPDAENLHNLDSSYYGRIVEELRKTDTDLVRRFVCNRAGHPCPSARAPAGGLSP